MESQSTVKLILRYNQRTINAEVADDSFIIGRMDTLKVCIPDCRTISREHLKVEIKENQIWITDLGSSNGSFYHGERLHPHKATLYDHSTLLLGGKKEDGVEIKMKIFALPATGTQSMIREKSIIDEKIELDWKASYKQYDAKFEGLKKIIAEMQAEAVHKRQALVDIEKEISQLKQKRAQINEELLLYSKDTQAEKERLDHKQEELKRFRKAQELERENIEAETRLARSKLVREIEEVKAQKVSIEAEHRSLHEESARLESVIKQALAEKHRLEESAHHVQTRLNEMQKEIVKIEEKKFSLEGEVRGLTQQIDDAHVKGHKIVKEAEADALLMRDKILQAVNLEKANLEAETNALKNKVKLAELEIEKKNSDAQEKIKNDQLRAQREHEDSLKILNFEKSKIETEVLGLQNKINEANATAQKIIQNAEDKVKIERELALQSVLQEKAKIEQEVSQLKSKIDAADLEIKKMHVDAQEKIKESQQKAAREHEESLKVLHQEKLGVEAEVSRLQLKIDEANCTAQKIIKNAEEQAKIEREEILKVVRHEKESIELEVSGLKKKIEAADLEIKKMHADAQALLAQERAQAESEVKTLHEKIADANRTAQKIIDDSKTQAAETTRLAEVSAQEKLAQAHLQITHLNDQNEQHMLQLLKQCESDIATKQKHALDEILKQKSIWEKDYEQLKGQAMADYDAATKAWKQELIATQEKDVQELRMIKTAEEKRIRDSLLQDIDNVVRHISTSAIAPYASSGSVSVSDLMSSLESSVRDAITQQSDGKQTYNPNLKQVKKKFWLQSSTGIAAAVALVFGIIYGPQFVSQKLAVLKERNQKADSEFMKEVRAQRERMLALHLVPREEFQDTYIDNILYNTGYLALKSDEEIRKQWVVRLSKFFFDELMFDDRKVVDFIPIETSMIRALADTVKILNNKNYDVNLVQMKAIEKQKTEEMWLAIGGRDNWLKLRKCEAEFFAQYLKGDGINRAPAKQ